MGSLYSPNLGWRSAQPDQLDVPKEVIGKVAQTDSRADARQPDILQFRAAHAVFHTPEDVLDMTTHLGLQPVELLLHCIQRPVPRALFVNVVLEAKFGELRVRLGTLVGAVREKILSLVLWTD